MLTNEPEPITVLQATVRRCGRNTELVSVRMVSAAPHVMHFIGNGGREQYGEQIQEMLTELMEKGYEWTVNTIYSDVSMMEYLC